MWIKTKTNTLFNLNLYRSVFIEEVTTEKEWEVCGYQMGDDWIEEGPYVFGRYETQREAEYALNKIYMALHEGRNVLDMP